MNKQELIAELTKYVKRYEDEMDEYDQGRFGAYKVALALTRQLDEPQKLVVPQFVAGWIEKSTDNLTKAEKIAYLIKSKDGDSYYFCDWFVLDGIVTQEQGEELLAWATRQSYETLLSLYNGYEVEKEPLYYVKLPSTYNTFLVESDDGDLIVWQNTTRGMPFTEKRIKAIDERYWAFAVKVEEVEG